MGMLLPTNFIPKETHSNVCTEDALDCRALQNTFGRNPM